MGENNINAFCKICGQGYHVCNSCREQKTFYPWRSITDSVEHYKIFLAIHGYTLTKNLEIAKKELENCDLTGLENFNPEIKTIIKEILKESEKVKAPSRKRKESIETELAKNKISE